MEAAGEIGLLSQMFPSQHRRAPGFPARGEEQARLVRLFSISCTPSACRLAPRGRAMVNGGSAHPPSAMQEEQLPKCKVDAGVNILRFQCPVMSPGSGSKDDLILLHASLVRAGTNAAGPWVGEMTAEEEAVREGNWKMGRGRVSCEGSYRGSWTAGLGLSVCEVLEQGRHFPSFPSWIPLGGGLALGAGTGCSAALYQERWCRHPSGRLVS